MKTFFSLIFISFVLLGCNKHVKNYTFSRKEILKYKILVSEEYLLDPWDLEIIDSTLIVANEKGEPLLELYNLQGERTASFLLKGNGPEEILMVGNLQGTSIENELLVFDLFGKKFLQYKLNQIIDDLKPDTVLNYSNLLLNSDIYFDKLFVDENFLIGESRSEKGRIVLMTKDGLLLQYGGEYPPKKEEQISDMENANLYSSGFTFNVKEKKMALSTYSAGLIDIFSYDNGSIIPIWSYCEFLPEHLHLIEMGETLRAALTDKTRYGYPDIDSSDKYIYALFSGKKLEEENYSFGNVIRIIDWNGINSLELHTNLNLRRIAVSKDDQYLYAIAKEENGNPCIVEFFIGDIINDLNSK